MNETNPPAHNPDSDGPKFRYEVRVDWPGEGGLTLSSGCVGPRGMAKLLRDEANAIDHVYPLADAVRLAADTGQAREPGEDAIRAADLCKAAAWLVANPQGSATWLNSVPTQARAHLATWLRTEEVLFRTDASRGSPIGFPSWHFAQTVHVQHNHVSGGVYGGCPACGTDWTLSAPDGAA